MPDCKIINLDAEERSFTKDGMEDFFYPVSRRTHLDFSIDMMKAYTGVISKHRNNNDIDLYKILAKYYISEVIGVFQGLLLKKGLQDNSCDYSFPQEYRIWSALFENKAPQMPVYIDSFKNGPAKHKYARKIFDLKFIKRLIKKASFKGGSMNIDGLKVKQLTADVLANDIIATQYTPLIMMHAGEVGDDVVFCRSTKWLGSVDISNYVAGYELSQIDADLLERTKEIMVEYGLHFDNYLEEYFSEFIKSSIPFFKTYLDSLSRLDNLPRRLWIGTSGNIWDCLLKIAVKHKGEYVCGHDHGTGQAHLVTPLMGIIELWGSDEFYTFSTELADSAPAWSIMDQNPVKVIELEKKGAPSSRFVRNKDDIKTIFLLSTVYDKDRGRMHPLMPDIVQLDWQARFVSFLKDNNYNVTIKSHPESAFSTPESFVSVLGAEINSEPFEDVFEAADLFVFDYICTSTFKEALKTDIPVIVIDFDDVIWTDKALDLIKKRCSFVKGHYDENNRLQINWDDFSVAVDEVAHLASNTEFYDCYYG